MHADAIDMLFGVQLGGGTDIHKSVGYREQFIEKPQNPLFFVITDLFEGGSKPNSSAASPI